MLKKRFLLFVGGFSFLIVIFNFSLVSASLEGASKIRLLSYSIILSTFEIIIATFVSFTLFKSVTGFSKRERQLSLVLDNTDVGVVVHNGLNEILFLNLQAEEILGIKFKDIAGIRLVPESSLRKDKLNKITEVVLFSKLSEGGEFTVEHKEVFDAGRKFFVKILKKAVKTSSTINGVEFVTTAAHQLRTPLSGVKWVLKMLLENPGFNQEQISLLKKGQATNEKIIKIVNDLLDTAKIESGKFSYDFKSVNPISFIENLISDFSARVNETGVRLVFDKGTDAIPNIKADSGRLGMVLENLIDNAIKYTPKDGEVKVFFARRNSFMEILVSDTGIGIPQEERAKVFSKFFRAGNAVKVDSKGAGLGLFIAYRIVSDHGGQMKFAPNSPSGSIFSFTIPFSDNLNLR